MSPNVSMSTCPSERHPLVRELVLFVTLGDGEGAGEPEECTPLTKNVWPEINSGARWQTFAFALERFKAPQSSRLWAWRPETDCLCLSVCCSPCGSMLGQTAKRCSTSSTSSSPRNVLLTSFQCWHWLHRSYASFMVTTASCSLLINLHKDEKLGAVLPLVSFQLAGG